MSDLSWTASMIRNLIRAADACALSPDPTDWERYNRFVLAIDYLLSRAAR